VITPVGASGHNYDNRIIESIAADRRA